jgi:hypothetical protein
MNKKELIISCPIHTVSGYGSHSRDIVKGLREMDEYDIKIIPQKWGNTPTNALDNDDEFSKWINGRLHDGKFTKRPDVFIQITVPNEFQAIGTYNIGITAGIETTLAPKNWIDGCNRMDLIITPSTFSRDVLLKTIYTEVNKQTNQPISDHRISKPIEVLFEGVDDVFKRASKPLEAIDGIEEDFVFLFVGHWLKGNHGQDRKDIGGLIETFCSTFKSVPKKDQPALLLKTASSGFSFIDKKRIWKRIEEITDKVGKGCPPVYLLHGELTEEEISSLYHHPKIKSMVSFTKGEGYGRPLCEFTFTEKPVIASKWSGHLDFLTDGLYREVEGELKNVDESVVDSFIIKESKWFNVSYTSGATSLFDVWKNYDKWLVKSKKLGKHNIKHFSLDMMNKELHKLMRRYVNIPTFNEIKLPKL